MTDLRFALRQLRKSPGFTIVAVISVLLAVAAAVACWIPARRAARVDPMITLRAE